MIVRSARSNSQLYIHFHCLNQINQNIWFNLAHLNSFYSKIHLNPFSPATYSLITLSLNLICHSTNRSIINIKLFLGLKEFFGKNCWNTTAFVMKIFLMDDLENLSRINENFYGFFLRVACRKGFLRKDGVSISYEIQNSREFSLFYCNQFRTQRNCWTEPKISSSRKRVNSVLSIYKKITKLDELTFKAANNLVLFFPS